jgi:hypothetical protein
MAMTELPATPLATQPPAWAGLQRRLHGLLPAAVDGPSRAMFGDLLLLGSILFSLTLLYYGATIQWDHPIPRDHTSLAIGRDFLNFWTYGRAAAAPDPGRFYDPGLYNQYLTALGGPGLPLQNWSYPPSVMLLAAPFGQLPYLAALALWTVLGVGVFAAVARRRVADWRILFAVLVSPAATLCLISGQSAFFTAAALVTIFAWLDRRPLAAGVLIGLLTIKPQLGLLFPVMLAVSGRWRVFASAAVTALALAGASAALFGVEAWTDFIVKGLPVQNAVLADPNLIATPYYPTVYMNIRGLGLPYAVAMTVQAVVSIAAVSAVAWVFRVRRDRAPRWLMAYFLACAAACSPYLLAYDLLALTFAGVALLAAVPLDPPGRRLVQLVYGIPMLQLGFGLYHLPGPALIAPAFAVYLAVRLARAPALPAVA